MPENKLDVIDIQNVNIEEVSLDPPQKGQENKIVETEENNEPKPENTQAEKIVAIKLIEEKQELEAHTEAKAEKKEEELEEKKDESIASVEENNQDEQKKEDQVQTQKEAPELEPEDAPEDAGSEDDPPASEDEEPVAENKKISFDRQAKRSSKNISPEILEEIERRREDLLQQARGRQEKLIRDIQLRSTPQWQRDLIASQQNESVLYGEVQVTWIPQGPGKSEKPAVRIPYGDSFVHIRTDDFLSHDRMKLTTRLMNAIVGAKVPFIVTYIERDPETGEPLFYLGSRKKALEQKFLRMAHLVEEGQNYPARIMAVSKRFMLVECLGIDFRLSAQEAMPTGFAEDLREHFSLNQEIACRMTDWDLKNDLIAVSLRRAAPQPEAMFKKLYRRGDVVTGQIVTDPKGGYFVSIPLGETLVQSVFCPNTSWGSRILRIGDTVKIRIHQYWSGKDGVFKVNGQIVGLIEKAVNRM